MRHNARALLRSAAHAGRFRSWHDDESPAAEASIEHGRQPTAASLALVCETHGAAPGRPCWTDAVCGARVARSIAQGRAS